MASLATKIPNLMEDPSPEKYRENLLQIEVYFDEFNFHQTKEYPAYLVNMMHLNS